MSEENWVGRSLRHVTDVDAIVFRGAGQRVRVVVTEMSEGGCRMRSDFDFPIGEHVAIALPHMGQIRAQIRWSFNGEAGARFDTRSYA